MSLSSATSCRPSQQDVAQSFRALPIVWRLPTATVRARVIAALVLIGCVGIWLMALWLQPDPRGFGTHEQLTAAPCSWPVQFGIPCPTCGFTTAVAHAARFDWPAAFRAQPAGALLGVAVYLVAVLAVWVLATGRGWQINWYRLRPTVLAVVLVGVLAAAWAFKIIAYRYTGPPTG